MKKILLFSLLGTTLLASCGKETSECNHLDENKDHICDLCRTLLSEHLDENKDHKCDYCSSVLSTHEDKDLDGVCDICGTQLVEPIEYAEWPLDKIQKLVKELTNSDIKIPQFNEADEIEIDSESMEKDGFFSIFCYTEDKQSEEKYKEIVTKNNWRFSNADLDDGYFYAVDPTLQVAIRFAYIDEFSNLEISVADASPDAHEHYDENKDHFCDECSVKISDCVDVLKDHKCDICGKVLSECSDLNNDHNCDYCEKIVSCCVDTNKDHYCDICGEKLSEHKDGDLNNICDYCGERLGYAEWPEKEIQDLVIEVSGSETKIPQYNFADRIEVNTDDLVTSYYFSIYCYTENEYSENEYKAILVRAGWEVENEKDEQGYYNAYDENYEVWLNFGYFEEFKDLEICVTYCTKTKWPGDYIAESIQIISPGSEVVIPEFEAYTTLATYYPLYNALAINAYGYAETIINDYKQILLDDSWNVSYNNDSQEWNAIKEDIELHFYVDDSKGEFNVDVFKYVAPVEGWPYEEIAKVVEEMGATGEVLPYTGENTGFKVDTEWYPPAIFIYCDKSQQAAGAAAYNQYLQDNGYIYAGEMYGDPLYAKPGTTLAMRALVMMDVLEIELFKLDEPAK